MTETTYIIKKNGKRYGAKKFDQYEAARSYVRKLLRKKEEPSLIDSGWNTHSNPSTTLYGFTINRLT